MAVPRGGASRRCLVAAVAAARRHVQLQLKGVHLAGEPRDGVNRERTKPRMRLGLMLVVAGRRRAMRLGLMLVVAGRRRAMRLGLMLVVAICP